MDDVASDYIKYINIGYDEEDEIILDDSVTLDGYKINIRGGDS